MTEEHKIIMQNIKRNDENKYLPYTFLLFIIALLFVFLTAAELGKSPTPEKRQKVNLKTLPSVSFTSHQIPPDSSTCTTTHKNVVTTPSPSTKRAASILQDSSFNSLMKRVRMM